MVNPQRFLLFLISAFLLVQGCTLGGQEGSDLDTDGGTTPSDTDTDTDTDSDSDSDSDSDTDTDTDTGVPGFPCGPTETCNLTEYCMVTVGGAYPGNTTYACTPLPNDCIGDETCLCLEPVCGDVGGSCTEVPGLTCEMAMP